MDRLPLSQEELALFLGSNSRTRRNFMKMLGIGAMAISLDACTQDSDASEKRDLELYNWDTYIGENTLLDFTQTHGVKVNISLFGENEEMLESVINGKKQFDVIVPSAEYVQRMAQSGFLLPLERAKLPNLANISERLLNLEYDKGNKYSVPYTWAVQGIAYRKSAMKNGKIPDSWNCLLDSGEYSGRIALTATPVDLFRMIYKYLGKSINSYSPELLAQAAEVLAKQMKHIKAFHDDDGQDLLLNNEVDLVWEYNGDIAQAKVDDPDIEFIIPKEGSIIDSDCLCIPKNAKSPNNAHKFINFVLDPIQGANISKTILYPTPNEAAKALMDPAYRNNKIIFPPQADLARCESAGFHGLEEINACEQAFQKLLAANKNIKIPK